MVGPLEHRQLVRLIPIALKRNRHPWLFATYFAKKKLKNLTIPSAVVRNIQRMECIRSFIKEKATPQGFTFSDNLNQCLMKCLTYISIYKITFCLTKWLYKLKATFPCNYINWYKITLHYWYALCLNFYLICYKITSYKQMLKSGLLCTHRHQHFWTLWWKGERLMKMVENCIKSKACIYSKSYLLIFYVCVSFKNEGSITQHYCS